MPVKLKIKKCKECGKEFMPQRPLQGVCSALCGLAIINRGKKKAFEIMRKSSNKKLKEGLKTNSDYKNDLQKLVNEIVRLIDKNSGCISCDNGSGQMQAGHYASVGGNNSIRFHLDGIYQQCGTCNNHRHGNLAEYMEGLIIKFGQGHFDYIKSLKVLHPELKLSGDNLKQAIVTARLIIKELKLLNETSDLPRSSALRVHLREVYNKELNLYGI